MIINKHFKTFLRFERKSFFSFNKMIGVKESQLKEESRLILEFSELFSFTENDKELANKLTLNLTDKEKSENIVKKFIYKKTPNYFYYLIQGNTESTSISVRAESKQIIGWRFLEKALRNSPFYYYLFDINFSLSNKLPDTNFLIFGMEVGSIVDYGKIYVEERNKEDNDKNKAEMFKKSEAIADRNIKYTTDAIEAFKVETNIL